MGWQADAAYTGHTDRLCLSPPEGGANGRTEDAMPSEVEPAVDHDKIIAHLTIRLNHYAKLLQRIRGVNRSNFDATSRKTIDSLLDLEMDV